MSVWSFFARHDGLVAACQLACWLVLLVGSGPALLREVRALGLRSRVLVGAIVVGAFAICAVWFPTFERFAALGHEASYAECFLGHSTPSSEHGWQPYVTYPVIRWGYWALGGLVGREDLAPLLVFNMAVRAATVGLFAMLARAVFRRDTAAVAAGLLLALQPTHAFWGTGIYNVAIPMFFVVLCVLQAVLAWRDGDRLLLAAAAASGSLVVATRVEWGILAPSLAVLLFAGLGAAWGRSPAVATRRFWAPALALVALYGVTIGAGAGALTTQGGYHGIGGYLATMGRQAWILDFFSPLHAPWGVALVLLGGVAAWQEHRRLPLGLLGFAVLSHCALATFNDFAYRHDLLPSVALLLLGARAGAEAMAEVPPWRRGLGAALLLATLATGVTATATSVERYYASVEDFQAAHEGTAGPAVPHDELEDGSCYLITDNERLWSMELAGSHFNLMEPGEAATHWQDHDGCIIWLYDFTDWRVDGLAVRSRALKLRAWFSWEPMGHASFPDGHEAVLYRMTEPPWGMSAPPPGWGWGGEEEIGGDEERGEPAAEPERE